MAALVRRLGPRLPRVSPIASAARSDARHERCGDLAIVPAPIQRGPGRVSVRGYNFGSAAYALSFGGLPEVCAPPNISLSLRDSTALLSARLSAL